VTSSQRYVGQSIVVFVVVSMSIPTCIPIDRREPDCQKK